MVHVTLKLHKNWFQQGFFGARVGTAGLCAEPFGSGTGLPVFLPNISAHSPAPPV
jgi:hypothetical protein